MDEYEVILPSDPEELEEMRAEEDLASYWSDVLPTITRNIQTMKALTDEERGDATAGKCGDVMPVVWKKERMASKSDDEGILGPPRKRAKVRSKAARYCLFKFISALR